MRRHSLVGGGIFIFAAVATTVSPRAQGVTIVGDLTAGTPREMPKGTGLIIGRVLDGDSRRPVERAIVHLSTPLGSIDPVMTDAQGRFVFRDLPKGLYNLRSTKPGYVDGAYAKRSADEELGRDGQPLVLEEDERVTDAVIRTWKHASISGAVTDEAGEPIVGAVVRALPRRIVAGRALFDLARRATSSTQTDDRGVFRFGSLPPGEYIVAVPMLIGGIPKALPASANAQGSSVAESSAGSGRWIGGGGAARGAEIDVGDATFMLSSATFRTASAFAGLRKDGRMLAYTTTFYGGGSSIARASVIALRSGEARENIAMQLAPMPTLRVSGTLTGPSGPVSMMLRLVSSEMSATTMDAELAQAVSDATGRFTFFGIPPGDYWIQVIRTPVARAPVTQPSTSVATAGGGAGLILISGGGRLPPDQPAEWASVPVSVSGADVTDVSVTLQTTFRIRGRVQFEGTGAPPPLHQISVVSIERADGREALNPSIERAGVDPQGSLITYGQLPGSYLIRVPTAPPGWRFRGAMHGGRDVSIVPLDVTNGDVDGVTLVFTDQPANELIGTVVTARGEPAATASVIVFPADRQLRISVGRAPRNLRAAALGSGGRYRVADLPAGAYLVAATLDGRLAWADPKFLDTLARSAQKITIADGEKRTLDLRMPSARAPDPGGDPGHGPWVPDDSADQQGPAREVTPAPSAVGSGVIAGVVTSAGDRPQPVRRAHVTIFSSAIGAGRMMITDETGQFEFPRLPAGRYSLSVEKPAYLTTFYGASRPGRAGTAIQLVDGQQMTGITLKLPRGATVSGVIRDDRGQPAVGVTVQAMSYRTTGGERRLMTAGQGSSFNQATDDRGEYRIYGLPPGEYLVAASYRSSTSFRVITEADVEAALQSSRQPAGRAAPVKPSPGMSYAPSFFPGTPDLSAATSVTLASGDEKAGVDFAIGFVPTATVEGTVVIPSGPLPPNVEVRIVSTGRAPILSLDFGSVLPIRPGPDGSFRFRGILPGRYAVVATTTGAPARAGGAGAGAVATPLWATVETAVNGTDISALTLSLQPGMTVSGRIEYRATTRPVPSLAATRVILAPQLTGSQISVGQLQVTAKDDGSFAVTGVMPGRYALRVLQPTGTTGWLLSSAMRKGVDLADHLLEVRPGEDVADLAVTLIDRLSDLSGVLQDTSGRPAPDYTVILFPVERTMWRGDSRRIRQARPGTDGKFEFRALAGGDYLLAAVTDVESGEWYDPAFLTELAKAAVKVTIATGESKVQDIRIAK